MFRNFILYNVYNGIVIIKDISLECIIVYVLMWYIWNIKIMVYFFFK